MSELHLYRLRVHQRVPQMELTMHEDQNKIIGYMVVAIVAYYILSAIVPFLIVGVVGLIAFRLIIQNKRGR